MKGIAYSAVVLLALLMPVERADVGELRPIQVICIYKEGTQVIIETDTGDYGSGKTFKEASEDLHVTAPGIVYLDTAEYLLLDTECKSVGNELKSVLKPSVRVSLTQGRVSPAKAADYLRTHTPSQKLAQWNDGEGSTTLQETDGRIHP